MQIKTKRILLAIRRDDFVHFQYSSRAKDGVFVDKGHVEGRVDDIYEHYITVMSPKGYRRTVRYADLICGHAALLEHRRGGEKVDEAKRKGGSDDGDYGCTEEKGGETSA